MKQAETWVPVPEFEGRYEVSDRGRLLNLRTGRILATPPDKQGYPQANLHVDGRPTHVKLHLLVLTTFAGPRPEGMQGRHLNDVKTDNRWPENLAWGTPAQNQGADRLRNGISNRGERHGLHKLTEHDVRTIRARSEAGEQPGQIASSLGRSRQCINHVLAGRRWGWLL